MLKKLAVLSVLSVLSMNLSAAVLSQERIQELQQKIASANAKDVQGKAWCQLDIDLLGTACPATFAELKQAAISSAKKHIGNDAAATRFAMQYLANRTAVYFPAFAAEGFALAQEYGFTRYACYYAMNCREKVGMSNATAYAVLVNALKGSSLPASDYVKTLSHVMKLAEDIDDETVKKDLQRINRVVTTRMTTDEETWKPVVIITRTLLDAYK